MLARMHTNRLLLPDVCTCCGTHRVAQEEHDRERARRREENAKKLKEKYDGLRGACSVLPQLMLANALGAWLVCPRRSVGVGG